MATSSTIPRILIVGTLDTKGREILWLADQIQQLGGQPILFDSSVGAPRGTPTVVPDIGQQDVAFASGIDLAAVWEMQRGEAVEIMQAGVSALIYELGSEQAIDAAICMGGAGAHLAGPAFHQLPLDIPKLIVSPLASGSRPFEPYVGTSNVAVMHSVVDIAGINRMSETIYRQAAGYIVGAAKARLMHDGAVSTSQLIAVSMNGNTTPGVEIARADLEESGYGLVAFHANGVGGRAMEEMIAAGEFIAVLDFTTTELAGATYGGLMDPGPDRMEIAGRTGIPQVLVPGCIDFITTGRLKEAKADFPGRRLFSHNPELTLVRMDTDQMIRLAEVFAKKANSAVSSTAVCVPTRGLSEPGAEGGPFWDPEADAAFLKTLKDHLSDDVRLRVVDAHINDPGFVRAVLEELKHAVSRSKPVPKRG